MMQNYWREIAKEISQATGETFEIENRRGIGGGCINQGYAITGNGKTYFIKLNQATAVEMFAAEALGLQQMRDTNTIRIPKPICWGTASESSYLVLEWLEFGRGNDKAWEEMGIQLAQMHKQGKADEFGWNRNNTIGSTPQINTKTDNWAEFFAQHRIGYQLKLAKRKGGNFPDTDKVINTIHKQLENITPQPSLVHGDLWSGNAAITNSGEPVILDPATYYGDREVDIAMTELFGGFPAAFYRGYNNTWPLNQDYPQRKSLYNLYHILNHFNLFGGGYGGQANRTIEQILSSSH